MSKSVVESLASYAGPVVERGYVFRSGEYLEFAVTDDGWAWVDAGDETIIREAYRPQWEFYLV